MLLLNSMPRHYRQLQPDVLYAQRYHAQWDLALQQQTKDPTKWIRRKSILDQMQSTGILTPRARACAIPNRGTLRAQSGWKWSVIQILPPLKTNRKTRWINRSSELTDTFSPFSHRDRVLRFPVLLTDRSPGSKQSKTRAEIDQEEFLVTSNSISNS